MFRKQVISTNIYSVGYMDGTLEVEFLSGGIYQYENVPYRHYINMISYSHPGTYFERNVKNHYRYRKIA